MGNNSDCSSGIRDLKAYKSSEYFKYSQEFKESELKEKIKKYYKYAGDFYSIIKKYDPSIFSKYKMNSIPHNGKKKEWDSVIQYFSKDELNEKITDMWLIIRPMDVSITVDALKKRIPILKEIESLSYHSNGNQGLSTIPNHWGLVFRTEKYHYVSLQYPPVTLQKAENKEHAIAQILDGSHINNFYYEEENMKRVFKGLRIINRINLGNLIELSNQCHSKKYNALYNNCQLFACTIIEQLTYINANEIRLKENIFRKGYTKEEERIINSSGYKMIIESIDKRIEELTHKYNANISRYIYDVIGAIIVYEIKNKKNFLLIQSMIMGIIDIFIYDFIELSNN